MPFSTLSILVIFPITTDPEWPSPVLICHKKGSGSSLIEIAPGTNLRPSPDSMASGITRGIWNCAPTPGSSIEAPAVKTRFLASAILAFIITEATTASEGTMKSVLKVFFAFPFLPNS